MSQSPNALEILLGAQSSVAPSVPLGLIETIYLIEERVQFDPDRRDAPTKIRSAVQAELDKESLPEVPE